jgi:hypothetical protein
MSITVVPNANPNIVVVTFYGEIEDGIFKELHIQHEPICAFVVNILVIKKENDQVKGHFVEEVYCSSSPVTVSGDTANYNDCPPVIYDTLTNNWWVAEELSGETEQSMHAYIKDKMLDDWHYNNRKQNG